MSLADFFTPIKLSDFTAKEEYLKSQFGSVIQRYQDEFPDLEDEELRPNLAIIGVEEDRASVNNKGTAKAPNAVRKHLYDLYQGDYKIKIADFGNIKAGETVNDTYAALKVVVEELVKKDIVPIIIGGGHDLTYAQYRGYQDLEQKVEVAIVDAKFDLDQEN